MRLALLACAVLQRELSAEIAVSPSPVSVRWLRQGLHDTPELLRRQLQEGIDGIEAENAELAPDKKYGAICIGYGLCSNGTAGLRAGALPLVIPRCDDCIALFLGSEARYRALFGEMPGTYWYNPGWIEHAFTPSEESYRLRFAGYAEKYGEDNAAYLMEEERKWTEKYRCGAYIESPVYKCPAYAAYARSAAESFGWRFVQVGGSQDFLRALLAGGWDPERFRICPPGSVTRAEYSCDYHGNP